MGAKPLSYRESTLQIRSMLLFAETNRLVVFVEGYKGQNTKRPSDSYIATYNETRIMVFNTSSLFLFQQQQPQGMENQEHSNSNNHSLPLIWEDNFHGTFEGARSIGTTVHVVTVSQLMLESLNRDMWKDNSRYSGMTPAEYNQTAWEVMETSTIPNFVDSVIRDLRVGDDLSRLVRINQWTQSLQGQENDEDSAQLFSIEDLLNAFTQVISFDVAADDIDGVSGSGIASGVSLTGSFVPQPWGTIYASENMLVFAMNGYVPGQFTSERTVFLLAFGLEKSAASPQATGTVRGRFLHENSLDIHDGYLRIATKLL